MERTSSFGYWLRRRRKALDLTQDDLARQVACSLETIKKIETDLRRPSRQMAERLADCLAIPRRSAPPSSRPPAPSWRPINSTSPLNRSRRQQALQLLPRRYLRAQLRSCSPISR